jgi:ParB family chromosome partitioning protein
MTDTAPPPTRAIEYHDPAGLLTDLNIRESKPNAALVASIRARGVLEPLVGYRTAGGPVRIRLGHRRARAALEAGQPYVPVWVVADEQAGDDVDRILDQLDENTHREDVSPFEQAGAVTQLLDLGLSVAEVRKRTRLPAATVKAARAVKASPAAAAAAAKNSWLTLEHAAGIAEFDGDQAACGQLLSAAQMGDGQFQHQLQRLRDDRHQAAARATLAAGLTAAGLLILDTSPREHRLSWLAGPGGEPLTADTHQACPGHAATLASTWNADTGAAVWVPSYCCTNPETNGHTQLAGSGSKIADIEEERQARREVLDGNKAWRAAETVRRAWLAELAARKNAPDGALRFVIESLARGDGEIHRALAGSQPVACQLLGLPEPAGKFGTVTPELAGLTQAADTRRLLTIALAIVLGAYEDETGVHIWRNPKAHPTTARYLATIASWGYHLSDIEQTLVDAHTETTNA